MADAGLSGQLVEQAVGVIRIDTQSIARDGAVVVRHADAMGRGIQNAIGGGTESAVLQAKKALKEFNNALGVTLGLFATMGTRSAQNVKSLEARFKLLAGSEQRATEQLAMLREMAESTNQPFLQVVEGAMALMPALRNSNAELDKTLLLTQRLAIIDPAQGVTGAAYAVREFLNGEYLSLVRRLELDRKRLQKIRDDSGGDQQAMIQGLSDYIDEMGVTEDALYSMGQTGVTTFAVLKSEVTETSADFFEPFLEDVLLPMARAFGDMVRELRQLNPELKRYVGITAGLAGVAAAGTSGLPIIGQIPGGASIARAGVYGAAAYTGAQGGAYIARKAGLPGTEGKSQRDVLGDAWVTFKQASVLALDSLVKLGGIILTGKMVIGNALDTTGAAIQYGGALVGNAIDSLIKAILDGAASLVKSLASALRTLSEAKLPGVLGGGSVFPGARTTANELDETARSLENMTTGLRTSDETMQDLAETASRGITLSQAQRDEFQRYIEAGNELVVSFGETIGMIEETKSAADILNGAIEDIRNAFYAAAQQAKGSLGPTSINVTDDLIADFEKFQSDMASIETAYNADREQELADHEQRKADLIASFQQQITDRLEDEGIRYSRALKATQGREAAIRSGMIEKIAESDKETAQQLAELTEKHNEDEADALQDHLDRMADIRESGQDAMFWAVAKFDASGLLRAQRNMEKQLRNEKDGFEDQRDERQKRLDEAVEEITESHDEQVRIARESGEEQIRDLWNRFNEEERIRDEDNARQMARLQREHQARMTELNTQHQARMTDLKTKLDEERGRLTTHWANTFLAQQTHLGALAAIEKGHRDQAEKALREWWERNQQYYIPSTAPVTSIASRGASMISSAVSSVRNLFAPGRATGGRIVSTGLHRLEAGEEVYNRGDASLLRRLLGGEITGPRLAGALGGGSSFSFGNINVPVSISGGDFGNNPERLGAIIGEAVRDELIAVADLIGQVA